MAQPGALLQRNARRWPSATQSLPLGPTGGGGLSPSPGPLHTRAGDQKPFSFIRPSSLSRPNASRGLINFVEPGKRRGKPGRGGVAIPSCRSTARCPRPRRCERSSPSENASCGGVRGEGPFFGDADTPRPPQQLCAEEKLPAWHSSTSPKSPQNHWGPSPGVCLCPPPIKKKKKKHCNGARVAGTGTWGQHMGAGWVSGGTWSCGQRLGVPVVMG